MSLQLYAHPFSSYCQKVLIALWADGTEFEYRMLDEEHPENFAELKRRWPFGKFPLLVDDGQTVVETSCIIDHLQAHHPGPNRWIPDGDLGRRVRFLDRLFDLYIMDTVTKSVTDRLRPEGCSDPYGAQQARGIYSPPTTGSRQISTSRGPQATCSPSPTARPRPRCSTPIGSRKSVLRARASPPTARACSRTRSSPARSTRGAPTAPISRSARPTAIKRRRRTSAAADRLRSPRQGALPAIGRRRSCHRMLWRTRVQMGWRSCAPVASSTEAEHRQHLPLGLIEARRACVAHHGRKRAPMSRLAGRRNRSTSAAGRRRWRRTCGSAGPSQRAATGRC